MAEDRKTLENQVEEINRLIEEKKRLEDERKKGRSDIRDLEKANASLYENYGPGRVSGVPRRYSE